MNECSETVVRVNVAAARALRYFFFLPSSLVGSGTAPASGTCLLCGSRLRIKMTASMPLLTWGV